MTNPDRTAAPDVHEGEVLPPGWAWTTLGEIADLYGGGTPSRAVTEFFTGDIVWLTPTEIPKNRIATLLDSKERITQEALRKSSARLLPVGTVLMTSRASIGYVAIAGTEVTTNQGFASFVVADGIFNLYLAYWLWANAEYFESIATDTTFKEISKTVLRTIALPLPPLNEQRRIVAAIEAQFTRLDAGVAALKRLQANLKRYKASVLKAACEGKLVPQNPQDEPAAALLGRILAERRAKWESERRAKGKDPRKLTYPEPAAPDTTDLPELPPGWVWASLGMLGEVRNGVTKGRKLNGYSTIEVPYLRVANVQNDYLDLSEIKTITIKSDELENYRLEPGDVLFNEGGDRDKLGRGVVWHGEIADCIHQNHVHSVRLSSAEIRPEWINLVRQTDFAREYFWRVASQTVNLASINATNLRGLRVPIPPTSEQDTILLEVDRLTSIFEELKQIVEANLRRAKRLRQSILKEAFAGRLVSQDADDEPAADLLARIRRERGSKGKPAAQQSYL